MCNNQCWKYDIKRSHSTGYKNHKFCKNCEVFFKKIDVGKYCPCCVRVLRTRPRRTKEDVLRI